MMNKVNMIFLVLVVFCLTFSHSQSKMEFNILKEDEITIAENPDHPVPIKESPGDIVFTEEFMIGATEGDPNYIFGDFISFAVDDEGNIYVLDWRGKTVKKFDRSGKFELKFGRQGQGPGEFEFPEEIRYLPDGHLMVFEGESQKYSCFTKEGEWTKTGRFHRLMFSPYFGFSNGNYIALNILRNPNKNIYITGIFNRNSELIKPLYQLERKPDPPWPAMDNHKARARRFAELFSRVAFSPTTVIALDKRENIYFAYTDKYEIKIYGADGKLNKIIRTKLPFLPVEKKDGQDFLEIYLPRDISTWSTMDISLQNKIKSMTKFPDKKPAFLSIIPMDDEYLMVVRDGRYQRNALVDIFDPSGRFVMEKMLGYAIKDGICNGGRLYTIYEDEDGNQCVKCYTYKFVK